MCALMALALSIVLLAWLLLPRLIREMIDMAQTVPQTLEAVSRWVDQTFHWLENRARGLSLQGISFAGAQSALSGIAAGTINIAGNLADIVGRLSLMIVLSYFFLCDRERLLLRLELLIPQSFRSTAVSIGSTVCRQLRLYLQGQLMIAAAVGILAAMGLALTGVRNAPALGLIIGLLNMIPYFGPFIGGIPAVLIALGDGWQKAALTVLVLAVVQQLDSAMISPRILGSLTGLSPGLVLVVIFAGARIAGIAGMLFALPLLMIFKTSYRIFIQRMEK